MTLENLAVAAACLSTLVTILMSYVTYSHVKQVNRRLLMVMRGQHKDGRSRSSKSEEGADGGAEFPSIFGAITSMMVAGAASRAHLKELVASNKHLSYMRDTSGDRLFDPEVVRKHFPALVPADPDNLNTLEIVRAVRATLREAEVEDEDVKAIDAWLETVKGSK
ncbi:MAG: hypothetical protein Q7U75_04085 [Desulfobacterales bacterium]|nr:hypothetical protein [Desulfobacterales bacterium]